MRRILFLFVLLFAITRPGVGTCGPLLNEILAGPARDWNGDGAYDSKNDEWVEIVNPGPGLLTLDSYILTDEKGKAVYGFSGSLAAGAVEVVYGSQSVSWETSHALGSSGLRLANGGDTIQLKQVVGSDTLTVDAYTYNANEGASDRSTGRYPDGAAAWQIFDSLNRYSGNTPPLGNGLPPTPGALNSGQQDPPTPLTDDTWGRVKSIYTQH